MSLSAEAPAFTADEQLDRPALYLVPDGAQLAPLLYPAEPEYSSGHDVVDDADPERSTLYAVPKVDRPNICLVGDAEHETFTQARFKRWLGSLTLHGSVETAGTREIIDDTNLLDKIREAKAGSTEALKMVDINVGTAVSEACFKDRHVTKVTEHQNENGELVQFGQTKSSVHRNALTMRPNRHPNLQEITCIEALNGHRIEDGLRAGKLKDCYLVVPSIVPEGVPEDDLGHKGDGYFLDSLTFVVQATTEESSSEVTTESAFSAGVEAEDGDSFEDRMAKRHDIRALAKVYERLGQEPPRTAAGFLNSGLYIPKDLMPNGVVDFKRWVDEATDEVLGREIERNPEDYVAIIEESKRREASLEGTRQKVVGELLASADTLATPMDAVQLMWQLVKKYTVKASFRNTHIDPRVFGSEAAQYITQIRQHVAAGEEHLAQGLAAKAQETAVVSGCGGGASAESSEAADSQGAEQSSGGSDKYGSLKFDCPHCHRTNTRQPGRLLSNCQHCRKDVRCG